MLSSFFMMMMSRWVCKCRQDEGRATGQILSDGWGSQTHADGDDAGHAGDDDAGHAGDDGDGGDDNHGKDRWGSEPYGDDDSVSWKNIKFRREQKQWWVM